MNYLVTGSKLWSLQPPSKATYSRVHAKIEAEATDEGNMFRCVQRVRASTPALQLADQITVPCNQYLVHGWVKAPANWSPFTSMQC